MENQVDKIENILRTSLQDENTKIHRLASETNEILVVSKKGENNSYSFYEPQLQAENIEESKVDLIPIDNIFDYLENNNVVMELPEQASETKDTYGRGR